MINRPTKQKTRLSKKGITKILQHEDKLAKALRENLARRRVQNRLTGKKRKRS